VRFAGLSRRGGEEKKGESTPLSDESGEKEEKEVRIGLKFVLRVCAR